jgi:hypothetical protein
MNLGKNAVRGFFCILSWTILTMFPVVPKVQAGPLNVPAPYPPTILREASKNYTRSAVSRDTPPSQEWTYHKTADNLHPDGNEQQMMWLMNRARANPHEEGAWLAATGDPLIEGAIDYWNVDLYLMQTEFDGYPARPPAAFDVRLYTAAKAHCDNLIVRKAQDHTGQFSLIDDAGFDYAYARGIVYSYAKTVLYGYAGFNIDWGPDGDDDPNTGPGMQPDRGHRLAIMSIDNPYTDDAVENWDTNVGIAVVRSDDSDTNFGPLVITGDFCNARTTTANHFNRLLVGTVWQDTNDNDQYDPGEGMGGITVSPDHGTYYAVTANSGGYTIPILNAGTYDVTFYGPGIDAGGVTLPAAVSDQSVLLDLCYIALPKVITGDASDITTNAANLQGSVVTHGQVTDFYFQYGTSDAYGSATPIDSISVDGAVTTGITGLAEDIIYHFRLVASNRQGTSYGDDQTFQTSTSLPTPPQAITGEASEIKTDAAYLNGSVVTHGQATEYYFQYGATRAYGTDTATNSVSQDRDVTTTITGLVEDTVYHFRLVVQSSHATIYGDDQIFRTGTLPPQAVTGDASGLAKDKADLNGSVVVHGQNTEYYFKYGTTDAYGSTTPKDTVSEDCDVTATITDLAEDTVYHFCLVASNSHGTSYGNDQTFQTTASSLLPPQAITEEALNIKMDSANLAGSVVSHGQDTEYYFQYGTTDAYGSATPSTSISVDGTVIAAVNALAEDTVYHFRLVASNDQGISFGADQTFQTDVVTPSGDTPENPPSAVSSGGGGGGGGCFVQTVLSCGPRGFEAE